MWTEKWHHNTGAMVTALKRSFPCGAWSTASTAAAMSMTEVLLVIV
jgi:hypothetical protein